MESSAYFQNIWIKLINLSDWDLSSFQDHAPFRVAKAPAVSFTIVARHFCRCQFHQHFTRFFFAWKSLCRFSLLMFSFVICWCQNLVQKCNHKTLMKSTTGLYFTNISCAAFMHTDPKSAKKTDKLTVFFVLLRSACVRAARRWWNRLRVSFQKHLSNMELDYSGFWKFSLMPKWHWKNVTYLRSGQKWPKKISLPLSQRFNLSSWYSQYIQGHFTHFDMLNLVG